MRVVKKINNNVAICLDSNNQELIAFGKGIGFPKTPYELQDLSKISRTYYGINSNFFPLLNEIPENYFELSAQIVDLADLIIDKPFSGNIVFTLADHIFFAVQRCADNLLVKMPISHDIQFLYDKEMLVGRKALKYIKDKLNITLPEEEAVGIALHFINAESIHKNQNSEMDNDVIVQAITKIIEDDFSIEINQNGFNFSRFASHVYYLLKRNGGNQTASSENLKLYYSMKEEFKEVYSCVDHISEYIRQTLGWSLNQEELLYLMLHINRLCVREDYDQ